jgi:hypothetical protein
VSPIAPGRRWNAAGLIRFVGLCGDARGLLARYFVLLLLRGTQAVRGVRCLFVRVGYPDVVVKTCNGLITTPTAVKQRNQRTIFN